MKRIIWMGIFSLLLVFQLSTAWSYEALRGPTEVIYYDKAKAYNGYTLFSHTYHFLIDMEGNVVNKWAIPEGYAPEKTARLLENGNLLVALRPPGGEPPTGGTGIKGSVFQELDWNGKVMWEWKDPRPNYVAHHNFKRIFNKKLNAWTTLIVTTRGSGNSIELSKADIVAKGADPSKEYKDFRPDGVLEVDMNGNVVWEWWSWDHVVQDKNPAWPNYGKISDNPGKIDMNWGRGQNSLDFIHINSLDYNEILDQVVVNASIQSEFYVIDHGNTFIPGDPKASIALAAGPKGDILYRWGNPSVFKQGKEPSYREGIASENDQAVHFTHDIQWIPQGLPGAGHFLLFDNGSRRTTISRSAIVEVNPYKGSMKDGIYVPQMEAGYEKGRSKQIVWMWMATNPNSFYSRNISGCQRLPNGNTLATSGVHGHFVEVTAKGEVVWEYINPMYVSGKTQFGQGTPTKVMLDSMESSVFTSHRYGPDYPGLKGKDLKPQGKITDIIKPTKSGGGGGY